MSWPSAVALRLAGATRLRVVSVFAATARWAVKRASAGSTYQPALASAIAVRINSGTAACDRDRLPALGQLCSSRILPGRSQTHRMMLPEPIQAAEAQQRRQRYDD